MRTRPRLAGAWTRLGGTSGTTPLGRLHATRRVDGALAPVALCGYRIPARQIHLRPFPPFETDHAKACPICAEEAKSQ